MHFSGNLLRLIYPLKNKNFLQVIYLNGARGNITFEEKFAGKFYLLATLPIHFIECTFNTLSRLYNYILFIGYIAALEGRAVVNLQMGQAFAALQDLSAAIKVKATAELLTNRGVVHQVRILFYYSSMNFL